MLLFTLENLAWNNKCEFVALSKKDIGDHVDVTKDLDYIIKGCGQMIWYIKYNN